MRYSRSVILAGCAVISLALTAQKKNPFVKTFQISVVPGLGTNGYHPGGYSNYFSINLTAGYSKASLLFEIGTLANINEVSTRGIQIAGLTNFAGVNAFSGMSEKERSALIKSGFEANLTGLQIAGLSNIVLTNVFGGQITGVVNVSKGALIGLQLAGLANQVNKFTFGVQLAGLWNVSVQSMDGVQLATLSNYTEGELFGFQVGAVNQAGASEGVNSLDNNDPTGVQIGLVNKARKMNGFQIGLVNIAGRSQGTQIGLVNIYRNGKDVGTLDGTAIGLFNAGDFGYLTAYVNDVFVQNYELSTGTFYKNGRIQEARFFKSLQNALIYSRTNWQNSSVWAVGYGLKKMHFTKSTAPGMNSFRFFAYGIDLLHVSHQKAIEKSLSLLTKGKLMAGTKLSPKLHSVYITASADINYYQNIKGKKIGTTFASHEEITGSTRDIWPGFSLGVMVR